MNTIYFRREFLKKVSVLVGTTLLSPFIARSIEGITQSKVQLHDGKLTPRINPAFRFLHLNDGSLELFTFQKAGSKISYHYSGLEAGILLMILENKMPETYIKELSSQYSLSDSECKIKISSAMDEFKKNGLIYYGEMMIAKKTEETYE